MKRIFCILTICMICISSFFMGYTDFVYADDNGNFESLRQQSDLVKAFQYYCKSRDLTIEGSVADGVTTFTTGTFNSLCNSLGINISQLQAELSAEYDGSGNAVKFLYNTSGINAFNRIFAQFLQDNELQVGDTNVNKLAYSGHLFENYDGTACLVTVTDDYNSYNNSLPANILYMGSVFYYDSTFADITSSAQGTVKQCSVTVNISASSENLYTFNQNVARNQSTITWCGTVVANYSSDTDTWSYYNPFMTVFYRPSTNKYYYGIVYKTADGYKTRTPERQTPIYPKTDQASDVYIISTTINNNNYEGDTIINNEGDIINNNPDPDPDPDKPNIEYPNNPLNPIDPDDPDTPFTFNMPDIDLPGLNIVGLKDKFPFSIPWDLAAFYAFMDAPPEAPRFTGTVDLKIYEWNYDIDFSPFDPAAELCRKLQFGLFVVGLIVATRSLIRG